MALSVSLVVMLLPLVAQFATEVQGAPTRHYRNTYDFLLENKGLDHDPFFKDCCQIRNVATLFLNYRTKETGVYDITRVCPNTLYTLPRTTINRPPSVVQARCDMVNNGGGWLVILRRNANASPWVNFNRPWLDYENGFGDLNTEFWYGLKNIHCLTQRDDVELMIELKKDGTSVILTYQEFSVGGPVTDYTLRIGQGAGSGNGEISYNNGKAFTTFDRDNDNWPGGNCAVSYGGGWWFDGCGSILLTNPHDGNGRSGDVRKPSWWNGSRWLVYTHIEMKVRPKPC